MSYYGLITDIIELCYIKGNFVVLFKCDRYDVAREGIGYKLDCHGITSINRTHKLNTRAICVSESSNTSLLCKLYKRSSMERCD